MKILDRRGKITENDKSTTEEINAVGVLLLIPVVAPRITSMSHSALIEWKKARAEYEKSVKARSKGDLQICEWLKESIKSTTDEKLLNALCTYRWGGISKKDVTDERILTEVHAIVERVKNDTLPDVDRLFTKELRLDTSETDVREQVLKYFMLCNQLIEEHGLVTCFKGVHSPKEKCKLLIESLSPNELKMDVKNAIRFQASNARSDECKLHDLILEKALEQDRDFRRRKRTRYEEQYVKADKIPKLQYRKGSVDQRGRGQLGTAESKEKRSD